MFQPALQLGHIYWLKWLGDPFGSGSATQKWPKIDHHALHPNAGYIYTMYMYKAVSTIAIV